MNSPKPKPLTPRTLRRASRGFTLIELMAVCAIMAVIAGVVMSNQGKFGGQVLLQNFAYDVALSLRQAQVYGISVQSFGGGRFNAGYGVNIDLDVSRTHYVLFADSYPSVPNGLYDPALNQDEVAQSMDITRGYSISELEVCTSRAISSCDAADQVNIVFVRPEPDALISWEESGGTLHSCLPARTDCAYSARIVMQSPRGDTMSVKVFNNGQIAVDQMIDNN